MERTGVHVFHSYIKALEARISNLERLIQQVRLPTQRPPSIPLADPLKQHEPKGAPQTSLARISLHVSDSESGDDGESHPKFGTFPPQGHHQSPNTASLSPSLGGVDSDDELFTNFEPESDKKSVVKDEDNARFFGKSSLFAFAHQAFEEKEHIHDPLRSVQTQRTEFWTLPDVFRTSIRILFPAYMGFSGSLPCSSPRPYGSSSRK